MDACERCGNCRNGRFDLCKNADRLAAAGKAALPFVAYAFDQGVDGAEEAGRALELALQPPAEPWSGWVTQYPGKMPVLRGAKEIAELNYHPEEGMRMFFVREVEP
jgi:hypothetical protein